MKKIVLIVALAGLFFGFGAPPKVAQCDACGFVYCLEDSECYKGCECRYFSDGSHGLCRTPGDGDEEE